MKAKLKGQAPAPPENASQKPCFGCMNIVEPVYYSEDPVTPWCKSCFVTHEMLETVKKNMPIWRDLLLSPEAISVPVQVHVPVTVTLRKRIKCKVVPRLSVPFD